MLYRGLVLAIVTALLISCGQSYEEQREQSRLEARRLAAEDSAALKVAVLPTIDCLPMYVAQKYGLYELLGADIRLKAFDAQMDIDTAITFRRVEIAVTDIVRAEMMEDSVDGRHRTDSSYVYLTATDAYWQLIANADAKVTRVRDIDDKMMAMTRHSATDLLSDAVVGSTKVDPYKVFRIQINDLSIRLRMMMNDEIEMTWLPEPQATEARNAGHKVLKDSRKMGINMGTIIMRGDLLTDTTRTRQREAFLKAYDMAVDSIEKYGIHHYKNIIRGYCRTLPNTPDSLTDITFRHITPISEADMKRAKAWVETARER